MSETLIESLERLRIELSEVLHKEGILPKDVEIVFKPIHEPDEIDTLLKLYCAIMTPPKNLLKIHEITG